MDRALRLSWLLSILYLFWSGGSVQAELPPAGTYFFFGGPQGVLQVTATGAFTGKAEELGAAVTRVQGPYRHETLPMVVFRGQFDRSGKAKVLLALTGSPKFGLTKQVLHLEFQQTPDEAIHARAVISDSWDSNTYATFTAYPLARAGKLAGSYTAALVPTNGSVRTPNGTGWMVLTLAANGKIQMRGRMGDGRPFSTTSGLRADHQFWLSHSFSHYVAYSSRNTSYPALLLKYTLQGPIQLITSESSNEMEGQLSWVNEEERTSLNGSEFETIDSSFSADVEVHGSMYRVPPPGTFAFRIDPAPTPDSRIPIHISMEFGGLENVETASFLLLLKNGLNRPAEVSPPIERLQLNLSNTPTAGTFKGLLRFSNEEEPRRFSGVFLQNENIAVGLFEGPADARGNTGVIRMSPL